MGTKATGSRNYSQCDSMLIGDQASANTFPYIKSQQPNSEIEHEASTCRISKTTFYLQSRGIEFEEAVSMMVSGFAEMYLINYLWNLLLKQISYWHLN